MEYIINDFENENIPDELDPYNFFGISKKTPINQCKKVFKKFITSPNMTLKKTAALAYDMIAYELNYEKKGNIYKVVNKDSFYYTTIGDLQHLIELYKKDNSILWKKDYLERSLLYIAARNG